LSKRQPGKICTVDPKAVKQQPTKCFLKIKNHYNSILYDKLHTGIYLAYKPVEYFPCHEDVATAKDPGDTR
jgi:hypothetical protein